MACVLPRGRPWQLAQVRVGRAVGDVVARADREIARLLEEGSIVMDGGARVLEPRALVLEQLAEVVESRTARHGARITSPQPATLRIPPSVTSPTAVGRVTAVAASSSAAGLPPGQSSPSESNAARSWSPDLHDVLLETPLLGCRLARDASRLCVSFLDDEIRLAPCLLLHVLRGTLCRHERRAEKRLELSVLRRLGLDLLEPVREVGALAPHLLEAVLSISSSGYRRPACGCSRAARPASYRHV